MELCTLYLLMWLIPACAMGLGLLVLICVGAHEVWKEAGIKGFVAYVGILLVVASFIVGAILYGTYCGGTP